MRGRKDFIAFHGRVFSIYVLQDIGMDKHVVECCVENGFLVIGTSFYFYTGKNIVPLLACWEAYLIEVKSLLFTFKIFTGIFYAYERYAYLHLYLFSWFGIIAKIQADIVTRHFFGIFRVYFIFSVVGVPLCFYTCHRALFFPVTWLLRGFVCTNNEVYGKYSLAVVITESSHQFTSFVFSGIYLSYGSTAFICEAFSQIEQYMTFTSGICEPSYWGT